MVRQAASAHTPVPARGKEGRREAVKSSRWESRRRRGAQPQLSRQAKLGTSASRVAVFARQLVWPGVLNTSCHGVLSTTLRAKYAIPAHESVRGAHRPPQPF
jgi:hypothetical protein